MNLAFREFAFGSPEYAASLALRENVLRRPLGLAWESNAFEDEEVSHHLGAFDGERLLACLVLKPLAGGLLKMRQVAVAPELQGRGVGSQLVSFSEQFARDRGYTRITAHARDKAMTFYHRLGYSVVGDRFLEVSVYHYRILKNLTA